MSIERRASLLRGHSPTPGRSGLSATPRQNARICHSALDNATYSSNWILIQWIFAVLALCK